MITSSPEAMAALFRAEADYDAVAGIRRNVSPTQMIPAVVSGDGGRRIVAMRWGFLPRWYKSPSGGPLLINARSETIAEKPAFREAVRGRRCLIPADGFYEWSGEKGAKVAHVMRRRDEGMIGFAGIWQMWGGGSDAVATCAIVTCAANNSLSEIHHRMPVVLEQDGFGLWLGEEGHGAARLMVPAEEDVLLTEPAGEETRAILKRRGG